MSEEEDEEDATEKSTISLSFHHPGPLAAILR